jgi:hypothetical protein
VAVPVVLPGAAPSIDRVGELPGEGTPGTLTLGDVGAAVPGAVVPGPAVAPPPRALPPLELAPPAPVPWAMTVGTLAISQPKAIRVNKRMAGALLIVSAGCFSPTSQFLRCSAEHNRLSPLFL